MATDCNFLNGLEYYGAIKQNVLVGFKETKCAGWFRHWTKNQMCISACSNGVLEYSNVLDIQISSLQQAYECSKHIYQVLSSM